jgi:ubiquinone biosynthesis protein
MRELMRLAKKHNGRFERTHTMVVRGIDTIKSTAEEVFPELDFFTEVKNYAVDLKMAESRNQKKDREIELLRKRAKLNKIKSIPENMASMVEQYSKGLAPVKLEMGVPDKTQPFITNIVRMLVDAFIIVALLVSSSIIVLSGMKPLVWGMPLLGFIGYSISILMIVINIIKRILRR